MKLLLLGVVVTSVCQGGWSHCPVYTKYSVDPFCCSQTIRLSATGQCFCDFYRCFWVYPIGIHDNNYCCGSLERQDHKIWFSGHYLGVYRTLYEYQPTDLEKGGWCRRIPSMSWDKPLPSQPNPLPGPCSCKQEASYCFASVAVTPKPSTPARPQTTTPTVPSTPVPAKTTRKPVTTEAITTTTTTTTTAKPSPTSPPITARPTTVIPTTARPITAIIPTTARPTTTIIPTTARPTTTIIPSTARPTTTVIPTTARPTTTVIPSTARPTTTVIPTTPRPTTTVIPSTARPTTTVLPSTARPTTTVMPTTARPTTTVMPTTARPTTTVMPTTARPTTTVMPTTARPTTTIKPTTARPTTTIKPTTARPTTTIKPTTARPTTTIKPTTTRPTTTIKPTTARPTTTVIPTTARPTTTIIPTTARLTTTVMSTTPRPTTTIIPTTPRPTTTITPTTPRPTPTITPTTAQPTTTIIPTTAQPTTTILPTTARPITSIIPSTARPSTSTTVRPTSSVIPTTAQPITSTAPVPALVCPAPPPQDFRRMLGGTLVRDPCSLDGILLFRTDYIQMCNGVLGYDAATKTNRVYMTEFCVLFMRAVSQAQDSLILGVYDSLVFLITPNTNFTYVANHIGSMAAPEILHQSSCEPKPACVFTPATMSSIIDFNHCYIASYGFDNLFGSTTFNSGELSKVDVTKQNTCKGISITPGAECFVAVDQSVKACWGDNGAPVFCHLTTTGETVLYGLVDVVGEPPDDISGQIPVSMCASYEFFVLPIS